METRFGNQFTNFGFRKIFGEASNVVSPIDFLNSVLPETINIEKLSFNNDDLISPKIS